MPMSRNPAARQRSLAALERYRRQRTPEGFATTKAMKITLPESDVELFNSMSTPERTKVVLAGLREVLGR